MGIKKLKDLIKKYAPNSISEVHLSNFTLKKVAVDVSLYMFRSKARANAKGLHDQWISEFIYIVASLRKYNIHPLFVYDSTAPVEKDERRKERASKKQSLRDRVALISRALEQYYKTQEIDPILLKISDQDQYLLSPQEKIFDVELARSKLERLKSQIIDVNEMDFVLTRQLFDILNVPYIEASTEAEKTCSFLCRNGIVDAVLTEDTDVLAYGAPVFLSNLDTVKGTVTQIDFKQVLEDMGIGSKSFLDLCILCGTDYNNNIKGIGPEKSYSLIKQYLTIENIGDVKDALGNSKYDVTTLNYIKCRQLFQISQDDPNILFKYTGYPDIENLKQFLDENGIRFNIALVTDSFKYQEVNLL